MPGGRAEPPVSGAADSCGPEAGGASVGGCVICGAGAALAGVPQDGQNRALSFSWFPQFLQNIFVPSYLLLCASSSLFIIPNGRAKENHGCVIVNDNLGI